MGRDNLFSTHPSTENRVAALLGMRGGQDRVAPARRGGGGTAGPVTEDARGPWG